METEGAKAGKPENSGRDQAGRFAAGASGNPFGKPPGTRHRVTMLAEKLLQDDAENVVRAVLRAAKGGDMTAAGMVLARILPVRKGCAVSFNLPPLHQPADVVAALAAVANAVAAGDLTPDEGHTVAALVEAQRRAVETVELERRIAALETAHDR